MSMQTALAIFPRDHLGESQRACFGATVDGCPPGVTMHRRDDPAVGWSKRNPGQKTKYTTQRRERTRCGILVRCVRRRPPPARRSS